MKLLIIGGASAIAVEAAKLFAADGAEILLVGRDKEKLTAVRDDLNVRGAKNADIMIMDAADVSRHQVMLDKAVEVLGGIETVLIAYGTLSDQAACERNATEMIKEFNTNAVSVLSMLTLLANYFEERRSGTIAVISSVAGDRGRGSIYVYGAAKAAVSTFLGGLRARLSKVGVNVITIKPGLVDTPMTANIKKNSLFASPQMVGGDIHRAIMRGTEVVYTPWFWRYVMVIIRNIPESIFKRTKL